METPSQSIRVGWIDRLSHYKVGGLRLPLRGLLSYPNLAIFLLCCAWLGIILLVNPVGEFPLNDDWSYARPVKTLVENGRLELTGFTSMPLIMQVLWGALFCLPFGFSFTALRISTIVLGLFGILAVYGLIKGGRRA